MTDARKKFAFKIYSSVALKTPVDTGRARGNWNVKCGTVDTTIDENAKDIQFKSLDDFPTPKKDESIYISNNLPYITTLEYGLYPNPPKKGTGKTENGYSKQAPQGMVGVTLAKAKTFLEQVVKEEND